MTESAATTLSVPEISCGHCKATIEGAVQALDGIEAIDVDLDAKTVTVLGGDSEAIVNAIEGAGYDIAG